MIVLPTKDQMAAAVATMQRAHLSAGYARPLRDRHAEVLAWAAVCAIILTGPPIGNDAIVDQ